MDELNVTLLVMSSYDQGEAVFSTLVYEDGRLVCVTEDGPANERKW